MRKILLLLGTVLVLSACDNQPRPQQPLELRESYEDRRKAECREIGLYWEEDDDECETFLDAYDLDKGYKSKKTKMSKITTTKVKPKKVTTYKSKSKVKPKKVKQKVKKRKPVKRKNKS